MNKNVCATLGDLFDALKDNINVEDIIYAQLHKLYLHLSESDSKDE